MTRDEAIRAAGPYYHVTPIENVDSILTEGLLPTRWDAGNYAVVQGLKGPMMCIAPARNRNKYLGMIRDIAASHRVALLEIDADTVSKLDCDLDFTNTELAIRTRRLKSDDFATLLLDGADLLCYEPIPPTAIRVVHTD